MARRLTLIIALFLSIPAADLRSTPQDRPASLYPIEAQGKWGYIDKGGKVVIQPKYEWAGKFSEGLAFFMVEGFRKGYINTSGEVVIPPQFGAAWAFHGGMARVWASFPGEKWARGCFINRKGEVVKCFDGSGHFSEGVAPVAVGNKWGFIDPAGNFTIPLQFDGANSFSEGLACVFDGYKFGFINRAGEIVIERKYRRAGRTGGSNFSDGLAAVALKPWGEEGYIDKTGKMVIQPQFGFVEDFSEGMAMVRARDGSLCFIDKSGQIVIRPGEAYELMPLAKFKDGLAMVVKDGKKGFINKKGEVVIPLQFDLAEDFGGGLAVACIDDTCGYIDTSGRYVWKMKGSKMILLPPH